ncbi:MAG: hypothetical protein D5R99_03630 [Methanocalculus sp. MSAO_Arc1]|nr:MAG: hypothetical protein D5R99_03630 [Methanocalculus sp. MSAO_Arc1]
MNVEEKAYIFRLFSKILIARVFPEFFGAWEKIPIQQPGSLEATASTCGAGIGGRGQAKGTGRTEVISPCSSEQPERRFQRNRGVSPLAAPGAFPPLPRQHLRQPGSTSLAKHLRTGQGRWGDYLIRIYE